MHVNFILDKMSRAARKPVFGFSDQFRQKTTFTNSEKRLEAGNFRFKKNRDCTIRVAKTKALISFTVTAKLICAFVFE